MERKRCAHTDRDGTKKTDIQVLLLFKIIWFLLHEDGGGGQVSKADDAIWKLQGIRNHKLDDATFVDGHIGYEPASIGISREDENLNARKKAISIHYFPTIPPTDNEKSNVTASENVGSSLLHILKLRYWKTNIVSDLIFKICCIQLLVKTCDQFSDFLSNSVSENE